MQRRARNADSPTVFLICDSRRSRSFESVLSMNSTVAVVRRAIPDERAALEALQRRASLVWEDYREALLAHPDAIALPIEQIESGRTHVAERQGKILGFSMILRRQDGDAELNGLFVEPGYWRQGVGTRLIRAAELFAASEGAGSMFVIANPRAVGFYAAWDFELIGEQGTRFGTALRMRKCLAHNA
jgi:GNAT superfamily N-acetyltransferase